VRWLLVALLLLVQLPLRIGRTGGDDCADRGCTCHAAVEEGSCCAPEPVEGPALAPLDVCGCGGHAGGTTFVAHVPDWIPVTGSATLHAPTLVRPPLQAFGLALAGTRRAPEPPPPRFG